MKENPLHLAIIPDGNRRWARSRMLLPWNGHERAVGNFRGLADWCRVHPRVGTLTLWCFSTENWKRDKEEVDKLMEIFESFLRREWHDWREQGTRLVHAGRTDRLPSSLLDILREAQEGTAANGDFTLQLAIDYGGRDEVTRAVRRMPAGTDVTEESIRAHLDHPEVPDIDLIVRTSGEQRTSNFFLWQSGYAEWVFLQKHFPELTTDDLKAALDTYNARQRRFGGG